MSLQRHIHVAPEDLQGKSSFGSTRTLCLRFTAQQGHEHLHALLKWTTGELRGVSALHWECSTVSCDHSPKDCLHPDWIQLQRSDSYPALRQTTGGFSLVVQPPSIVKQTRRDMCSKDRDYWAWTTHQHKVHISYWDVTAWQQHSLVRTFDSIPPWSHSQMAASLWIDFKKSTRCFIHLRTSYIHVMSWCLILYQFVSGFVLMYSDVTGVRRSRKWGSWAQGLWGKYVTLKGSSLYFKYSRSIICNLRTNCV